MSAYNETYWTAAATAGLAALWIRSPWAFYVAGMIGTMVSNPEGMDEAAKNWHSTTDLDELDAKLKELKKYLEDAGTWDGDAFQTFSKVHEDYQNAVTQLKESREATGDGVESSAIFFKVGALVCTAVAAAMVWMATVKIMARAAGPTGTAVAAGAEVGVAQATTSATKQVYKKHLTVISGLTAVLYFAKTYTETSGRIFPGLEAMPTAMSSIGGSEPFAGTEMEYDEKTGTLTPKFDLSPRVPPRSGRSG